jgi:hypothetical protein
MSSKIDKMEGHIEHLVALANQGRGGFWAGMAFISLISSAVGFFLSWIKARTLHYRFHSDACRENHEERPVILVQ